MQERDKNPKYCIIEVKRSFCNAVIDKTIAILAMQIKKIFLIFASPRILSIDLSNIVHIKSVDVIHY